MLRQSPAQQARKDCNLRFSHSLRERAQASHFLRLQGALQQRPRRLALEPPLFQRTSTRASLQQHPQLLPGDLLRPAIRREPPQ
eukprot:11672890-Alexandrium_andersonii.AAC.1